MPCGSVAYGSTTDWYMARNTMKTISHPGESPDIAKCNVLGRSSSINTDREAVVANFLDKAGAE